MLSSGIKTFVLMAVMTSLLMMAGAAIGGRGGLIIAFLFGGIGNLFAYWNSDKIVLRMYNARPIDPDSAPGIVSMVKRLCQNADLPMPALYIIPSSQPNAFATGRNPDNAAVAVNQGLVDRLTTEELAAVIAHELAHIKNRDTLLMTIAATLAGVISSLSSLAFWFGMGRNGRGNAIGQLLLIILAPLAAALIQSAISRTREFAADREGAEICGHPTWLASALEKIQKGVEHARTETAQRHPETAHLFIINPLHAQAIAGLFATHPPTEDRIQRLRDMV